MDLDHVRKQLEERKLQLMQRLSVLKRDITRTHSADWSEQAQERQNDEVMDVIGNESSHELAQINRALARIDSGDYTICAKCGEEISEKRLAVVPYTNFCIRCAH